ncbi:MAG: hypothetical protein AB7I38_18780 [Dehalococcoidia bacterium]
MRRRATHVGMANGVALTSGCELLVVRCGVDGCPTPPVIRPVGTTPR